MIDFQCVIGPITLVGPIALLFYHRFRCVIFCLHGVDSQRGSRGCLSHFETTFEMGRCKRWLVPHLRPLWHMFSERRFVEPFCGGLAVALGLRPTSAVLNDVNPHLVNFYRQLKRGLTLSIEMRNEETLFYKQRDLFNQLIRNKQAETAKAAQIFYYLNRTCFNGLCRFNQSGEFNVPFGTYSTISYARDLSAYKSTFKSWVFTNQDFSSIELQPGDFVYADPPYDVEFTTYSAGGFSWEDQIRTAKLLAEHSGPVVISNQATDRIVQLYQDHGYQINYLDGPRRISCTGDRSTAREVLAVRGI